MMNFNSLLDKIIIPFIEYHYNKNIRFNGLKKRSSCCLGPCSTDACNRKHTFSLFVNTFYMHQLFFEIIMYIYALLLCDEVLICASYFFRYFDPSVSIPKNCTLRSTTPVLLYINSMFACVIS